MLEVKGLTKRFGERLALDDVSFAVEQREVFGYLGPNGSGKTTTMRLLLGLLKPTSGEALMFGQRASDNGDVRRRVGVLLETDGLYPRLSAYDNLDYFGRLYRVRELHTRITQLLDFAGLAQRTNDSVGTFSRGMRRKLGLVRALLHSPDMLLLDEPSAGLEVPVACRCWEPVGYLQIFSRADDIAHEVHLQEAVFFGINTDIGKRY